MVKSLTPKQDALIKKLIPLHARSRAGKILDSIDWLSDAVRRREMKVVSLLTDERYVGDVLREFPREHPFRAAVQAMSNESAKVIAAARSSGSEQGNAGAAAPVLSWAANAAKVDSNRTRLRSLHTRFAASPIRFGGRPAVIQYERWLLEKIRNGNREVIEELIDGKKFKELVRLLRNPAHAEHYPGAKDFIWPLVRGRKEAMLAKANLSVAQPGGNTRPYTKDKVGVPLSRPLALIREFGDEESVRQIDRYVQQYGTRKEDKGEEGKDVKVYREHTQSQWGTRSRAKPGILKIHRSHGGFVNIGGRMFRSTDRRIEQYGYPYTGKGGSRIVQRGRGYYYTGVNTRWEPSKDWGGEDPNDAVIPLPKFRGMTLGEVFDQHPYYMAFLESFYDQIENKEFRDKLGLFLDQPHVQRMLRRYFEDNDGRTPRDMQPYFETLKWDKKRGWRYEYSWDTRLSWRDPYRGGFATSDPWTQEANKPLERQRGSTMYLDQLGEISHQTGFRMAPTANYRFRRKEQRYPKVWDPGYWESEGVAYEDVGKAYKNVYAWARGGNYLERATIRELIRDVIEPWKDAQIRAERVGKLSKGFSPGWASKVRYDQFDPETAAFKNHPVVKSLLAKRDLEEDSDEVFLQELTQTLVNTGRVGYKSGMNLVRDDLHETDMPSENRYLERVMLSQDRDQLRLIEEEIQHKYGWDAVRLTVPEFEKEFMARWNALGSSS